MLTCAIIAIAIPFLSPSPLFPLPSPRSPLPSPLFLLLFPLPVGRYLDPNLKAGTAMPTHLSFLAGSLAGVTASATTYPLDLVRARMAGMMTNNTVSKLLPSLFLTRLLTS